MAFFLYKLVGQNPHPTWQPAVHCQGIVKRPMNWSCYNDVEVSYAKITLARLSLSYLPAYRRILHWKAHPGQGHPDLGPLNGCLHSQLETLFHPQPGACSHIYPGAAPHGYSNLHRHAYSHLYFPARRGAHAVKLPLWSGCALPL